MGKGGGVHVHGYTKSDGTHVKGYTRSAPSSNVVHVHGYTKSDGTKIKGYTRSKPHYTNKTFHTNVGSLFTTLGRHIPDIHNDYYDDTEEQHEQHGLHEPHNLETKPDIKQIEYEIANPEKLHDEMLCPISKDIMLEPTITDCGHSFDKKSIEYWLTLSKNCPICRKTIDSAKLEENAELCKQLQELKFKIQNKNCISELLHKLVDVKQYTLIENLFKVALQDDTINFEEFKKIQQTHQ